MSHLPILIPGRTEPVQVPCSLPDSWTFDVFLPDRGVRKVSVFWKSSDPLKMDACEVALSLPDPDTANHIDGDPYWVAEDEHQRMQDAAGDVLSYVMHRLGLLSTEKRSPVRIPPEAISAIARSFLAECEAFETQVAACHAMPRKAGLLIAISDPRQDTRCKPSAMLLDAYVEWCVDEACKAQDAKAQRQARDYEPVVSY